MHARVLDKNALQAHALTAGLPDALRGQSAVMAVTSGARTLEGQQVAHSCPHLPRHAKGFHFATVYSPLLAVSMVTYGSGSLFACKCG